MASSVRTIENNINDVLRMKGDTDPWSRKVSLLGSMNLTKYRRGGRVWGTKVSHLTKLEERLISNSKLHRIHQNFPLDIESLGLPSKFKTGRVNVVVPNNNRTLSWSIENVEFQIQVFNETISDWTEVLTSYEDLYSKLLSTKIDYLGSELDASVATEKELQSKLDNLTKEADKPATEEVAKARQMEIELLVHKLRDVNREIILRQNSLFQVEDAAGVEIIKENLRISLEIVDTLRLCLSFYEDAYTILGLFDDSLPDQDDAVNFIDIQLSKLEDSVMIEEYDAKLPELREYSLPKSSGGNQNMLTAFIYWLRRMKKHIDQSQQSTFEVESPFRNSTLRKDVLSFGQKSTILTELYLGTFEALSQSTDDDEELDLDNRYCLIIDEPEVGRSEYSLDLLIKRLKSSKNIHDNEMQNSVVVLSHRNKLLKQVSGKYHLLQPVDIGYQTEEE